jgi:hypothetical protein
VLTYIEGGVEDHVFGKISIVLFAPLNCYSLKDPPPGFVPISEPATIGRDSPIYSVMRLFLHRHISARVSGYPNLFLIGQKNT